MQKKIRRRGLAFKIKKFLDSEISLLDIFDNPKRAVGGFISAFLVLSAINVDMNVLNDKISSSNSAIQENNQITIKDIQIPEDPPPGANVDETGTHFAVTGSQYLNVTVDTADSVMVSIESIPEIILMSIESESPEILSTKITIGGLNPLTEYHKYEDDYTHHEPFVADNTGKYTYTQDLAVSHFVYFQPRPSTKIITADTGGDCNSIGLWDATSKICTLNQDINESIQVDGDGITLDGNSHKITGTNTGFGISVFMGRKNVVLKNLNISNFSYGIVAYTAFNNTIKDNVISNTTYGIRLFNSLDNTIAGNILNNNLNGIVLYPNNHNNIIRSNTVSNSRDIGIDINSSNNNTTDNNTITNSHWGIYIRFATGNVIDRNKLVANGTGITLGYISTMSNKIVNNSVKNSSSNISIRMHESANNNLVYNNYFNNPPYFNDSTPYGNVWNYEKTLGINIVNGPYIGGNYWGMANETGFSDTCVDADSDGICDTIYTVDLGGISMVIDNLPLAKPDIIPPVTSMNVSGTVGNNSWYVSGAEVTLTALDGIHGSGVSKTEYSFDNANWLTYSVPFMIGDEGSMTVYYRSVDNAGNIELVQSNLLKIDKSAPIMTGSATSEPNINGWYNKNVTIRFNCNDIISGPENPSVDSVISTDGANQSASGNCVDLAGNKASLEVGGINVDKTAPVVMVTKSPDANTRGWNNTPVKAIFNATDGLSGIDGGSTNEMIFNSNGSNQSGSFTFIDKAGNSSFALIAGINIDLTPPVIVGNTLTSPNENNWFNSDVTVAFAGSDTLSGLASISPNVVLTYEGSSQDANGTAEDLAGNIATFKVSGINIDKTAPTLSGAALSQPNINNWYNNDVMVKFTATDSLSGIAIVSQDAIINQEGINQTVQGYATDKAGNTANTEVGGINIDKTPPLISGLVLNPPNNNGWYQSDVAVHFEANDSLSGVNSITPDTTIVTEGADQSASGEAYDKAGNTASYTVSGINIDRTAPVTTAIISGNSVKNICSAKDTIITLTGNDNLSGIASTQYNLDSVGWFTYVGKLTVGSEGQHTLKFNSQDNAANVEAEKEVSFTVDKTPAEALIKFDPQSKDIKVYNSRTNSEVAYTVISRNETSEGSRGWTKRKYKMTSCGDSYIILTLMHKKHGGESKIKVISLQQNNLPKINFKETVYKAEYSTEKNGAIKELEQEIESEKMFDISAKYNSKKSTTVVKIERAEDSKEAKEVKQGMAILELLTNKGSFTYSY